MRALRPMLLLSVVGAAVVLMPGTSVAQKKDRNTITREEIELSPKKSGDIYQVIRALRPHFLAAPRGNRSMGMTGVAGAGRGQSMDTRSGSSEVVLPVVYINGNRSGELDGLKTISALDVREVKYYEPSKAGDEFGPGHEGGVVALLLVTSTDAKPVPPKPPLWYRH